MNQISVLDRCKNHELAWIELGWSRINLSSNSVGVYGKVTNYFKNNTAELLLYFRNMENNSLIPILISCHCVWNTRKWFFKLKINELTMDSVSSSSSLLDIPGWITEFKLYETDSFDNSLDYNTEEYLSDALFIYFSNRRILSLISCMGDDEHEPSIWINYFDRNQVDIENEFEMKNWILRETR